MSARSFRPELIAACCIVAGCGKKAPPKPEADPKKVVELAKKIVHDVPAPAAVPNCKPEQLTGASMTQVTLLQIAHEKVDDTPEHADWINPPQLDSPAARVLADPKADATTARQAAAELLAAPGYTIYRVDIMNSPLALGVKDPKIGSVSGRALHYDKSGAPVCVVLFGIEDDPERGAWAVAHADRAYVQPEIVKAMREDLNAQYLKYAPRPPPAKTQ
jgi:hypothetical protein